MSSRLAYDSETWRYEQRELWGVSVVLTPEATNAPISERPSTRRRRWRWVVVVAVVLLVLAYLGPSLFAVRSLTVAERMSLTSTPTDHGLRYENVAFLARGDGITLRGWLIDGGPGSATVIMVHGKDSIRDDPGPKYLDLAAGLAGAGYDVLMFDLRGHGESDFGRFTLGDDEPRDVLGAIDELRSRGVDDAQIIVLGFSTGAVSALDAVTHEPRIGGVVADGAWPDLRELLDAELPRQSPLPSFYNPGIYLMARLVYDFDVNDESAEDDVATMAAAQRPMLLIHGTEDRYTSEEQAARMAAAAASDPNAEFWQVEGAPHVMSFARGPDEYLARLLAFLERSIGAPS